MQIGNNRNFNPARRLSAQNQSQPSASNEKPHSLPPIRRKNPVSQQRPHQHLPLITQTITPKIAREHTLQILRLNRGHKRPRQKRYPRRVDPQEIEPFLGHFERPVLFDGPAAGPEEIETQEGISVAPFAQGLAAFGGDEAPAGRVGF